MRIIKIAPLKNGAHRKFEMSISSETLPNGYAIIPDDMVIPDTFPFVNIEVTEETRYNKAKRYNEETEEYETEQIPYTVMVVTSMTEGIVPEVQPTPKTDEGNKAVTWNELAEAYVKGVNSIDE